MKKIKIISRVIVINDNKLLLVKNHNRDFWSLPGGHWKFEDESLGQCAIRETKEETGYSITLNDVLFCKEFRKPDSVVLEVHWNAIISTDNDKELNMIVNHTDLDKDSEIEQIKWFDKESVAGLKIKPDVVLDYFVNNKQPKMFIGEFVCE